MGCSPSLEDSSFSNEIKATGITLREMRKLRKVFNKIDTHRAGVILIDSLLSAWDLKSSELCRLAFSLFDLVTNNGTLEFQEFVLLTWHFCVISARSLGFFLLEMIDASREWSLDTDDITKIFRVLRISKEKAAKALHETPGVNLFDHGRHSYDIDRWDLFCTKYVGFFSHAFEDQERIRKNCCGTSFWKRIRHRSYLLVDVKTKTAAAKFMDEKIKDYMKYHRQMAPRWPSCTIAIIQDQYVEMIHMQEEEKLLKLKLKEQRKHGGGLGATAAIHPSDDYLAQTMGDGYHTGATVTAESHIEGRTEDSKTKIKPTSSSSLVPTKALVEEVLDPIAYANAIHDAGQTNKPSGKIALVRNTHKADVAHAKRRKSMDNLPGPIQPMSLLQNSANKQSPKPRVLPGAYGPGHEATASEIAYFEQHDRLRARRRSI